MILHPGIDYGQLVVPTEGMVQVASDGAGGFIDILTAANGLACGAFCDVCSSQMVAKQGDVIAWHFAHHVDSDCAGGGEGVRHLRAKQAVAFLLGGTMEVQYPDSLFRADVYAGGFYFEIIDSNPPSREKMAFIEEHELPVILLELSWAETNETAINLLERSRCYYPDADLLYGMPFGWGWVARDIGYTSIATAHQERDRAIAAAKKAEADRVSLKIRAELKEVKILLSQRENCLALWRKVAGRILGGDEDAHHSILDVEDEVKYLRAQLAPIDPQLKEVAH